VAATHRVSGLRLDITWCDPVAAVGKIPLKSRRAAVRTSPQAVVWASLDEFALDPLLPRSLKYSLLAVEGMQRCIDF
jgi:hypothetical protein